MGQRHRPWEELLTDLLTGNATTARIGPAGWAESGRERELLAALSQTLA
jgi:hypothetical protein